MLRPSITHSSPPFIKQQSNLCSAAELLSGFNLRLPCRLLVVRLLSPLQPRHLTSLAEELEESACRHAVTVVLQRRQDEPGAALLAALPSRELSWELSKLRAQGYAGLPHTWAQVSMCEGDQLLLRFCGNITSKGERKRSTSHENMSFCYVQI